MGLGRFFAPKTQHADAAVRIDALAQLPPGDDEVHRLATEDPDPSVRVAALARVLCFEILDSCARDSALADDVRAAVESRWQHLVGNDIVNGPDRQSRIDELESRGNRLRWLAVARSATVPAIRLAAVEHLCASNGDALPVDTQRALAGIAGADASADVRLAALAPVQVVDLLEAVANDTRKRDKRVHRLARDRVQAIRAAAAHRDLVESLCRQAEQLAATATTSDATGAAASADLDSLRSKWRACIDSGLPVAPEATARFETALQPVAEVLEAENKRRARITQTLDRLRRLAETLDATPASTDRAVLDEVAASADALSDEWAQLGEPTIDQARAFESARRHIEEGCRHRARDIDRQAAAARIIERATARVDGDKPLGPDAVISLEKRWAAVRLPEDNAMAGDLKNRYATVRDRTADRLVAQKQARERRIDEITGLIDRMESSLEAGKLADAISSHDKARHRLRDRNLPAGPVDKLARRLHKHESRIAELRKWRHFGTDVARERLCEQAQALVDDTTTPPADAAKRVRELRDHWQKLDRTDGPASEALWKRFDAICETAYAPSQAYFDEQSKARAKNLENRQAICDRLQALVDETDWSNADYRDVTAILREGEKRWRHAGPVDRRKRRGIEERHRAVLATLDEHLDAERQREIRRRRGLIRMVQGLAATEDVHKAAAEVRDARRAWAPTVGASRKEEAELWAEFCAACDAIEQRRDADRAQSDAKINDAVARRETLIASIATLAREVGDMDTAQDDLVHAINQAQGKYDQARADWEEAGELPKGMAIKLERRFSAACERVVAALDKQRRAGRDRESSGLRSRADICDRLEQAALIDAPAPESILGEADEAWAAAGPVDRTHADAIEARYQLARQASAGDSAALSTLREALDDNLARRRELCLKLEVLAGVDSPPDEQEARMALRVARLGLALASGGADPAQAAMDRRGMERAWCVLGPVAPENYPAITGRYAVALEAARAVDA